MFKYVSPLCGCSKYLLTFAIFSDVLLQTISHHCLYNLLIEFFSENSLVNIKTLF